SAICTASCPLAASPSTLNPSRSSSAFRPWRTIWWSSAINTVTDMLNLPGYGDEQPGTLAGAGFDLHHRAQRLEFLADSPQPQALPARGVHHRLRGKSHPVVGDGALHRLAR